MVLEYSVHLLPHYRNMNFIGCLLVPSIVGFGWAAIASSSSVVSISLDRLPQVTVSQLEETKPTDHKVYRTTSRTNIHLRNVDYYYFIGWVKMGTPGQQVLVVFDTASSDLWVSGRVLCKESPSFCRSHRTYDPKTSSTYVLDGRPYSLDYITGSVVGVVVRDSVTVAGMAIKNQTFAVATTVDDTLATYKLDGILGLGLPALSEISGVDPPFISMVKQGLVKQPVFAFFLSKTKERKSELTLGGVDPTHYVGKFTFAKVYGNGFWIFRVDRISVDDEVACEGVSATPDSGSSIILGPPKILRPIISAVGEEVSCEDISKLPTITFTINNQPFPMTPEDYIKVEIDSHTGKKTCLPCFTTSEGTNLLILGDTFMQKYYTQFDVGRRRIGFARAKQ